MLQMSVRNLEVGILSSKSNVILTMMPCCFIASKAAWARSLFSLSALVSHVPSFFLLSWNITRVVHHLNFHNLLAYKVIHKLTNMYQKFPFKNQWITNNTFRSFSFSFLLCFRSSSSLIFSSLSCSNLSASLSASSSCLLSSSWKYSNQTCDKKDSVWKKSWILLTMRLPSQ